MRSTTATCITEAAREAHGVRRERKNDRRHGRHREMRDVCAAPDDEHPKTKSAANIGRAVVCCDSPHAHGTFDGGAGGAVGAAGFEKSTVGASRFAAFVTSK